ncbi:MAG: hypothetical protein KF847_14610 [Pirellulales bacterium]|nr:hypothetical protein [Pirellulales bacterium]
MNSRMARRALLTLSAAALIGGGASAQTASTQEGWFGGVDFLFLSPKISEAGVASIFFWDGLASASQYGGSLSSPLNFAQRVFVGYQGDGGGGAQVRWFTFDNTVDYVGEVNEGGPPIQLFGSTQLEVDAVDLELLQRGNFANWNWMGTAGVRIADVSLRENSINFEDLNDFVWGGSTGVQFQGAGPTLSVQGARPILLDGLSIFANARTALLYGDTDWWTAFPSWLGANGGRYTIRDDFVQVWEFQFGLQHTKQFEACDLFTGIFWEAQRWESDSGFLGDLGFHGFGVRTGLVY